MSADTFAGAKSQSTSSNASSVSVDGSESSDRVYTLNRPGLHVGDFQIIERVPTGFALFRAAHLKTGEIRALRCVDLSKLSDMQTDSLLADFRLLKLIVHPCFSRLYEIIPDVKNKFVYLVREFMDSGSLMDVMKTTGGSIPEPLLANYMQQLLSGLAYLHQQGIVHRNLRTSTILLTKEGVIKVNDFSSIARLVMGSTSKPSVATASQTPSTASVIFSKSRPTYFTAPELIEAGSAGVATPSADIWSVGCTIIEAVTGVPPWGDLSEAEAIDKILHAPSVPLPATISNDLKEFLASCLQRNPEDRAKTSELLNHRWITSVVKPQSSSGNNNTTGNSIGGVKSDSKQAYEHESSQERQTRLLANAQISGNIQLGEVVGEGAFGVVHKAIWHGTEVAVKKAKHKKGITAQQWIDIQNEFKHEILICVLLGSHPRVVTFIGAGVEEVESSPMIVMNFLKYGSVEDFLILAKGRGRTRKLPYPLCYPMGRTQWGDESWTQSAIGGEGNGNGNGNGEMVVEDSALLTNLIRLTQMLVDASAGILHCHTRGVVHRDIAARNFLVDSFDRVYVSDFGMSLELPPGSDSGVASSAVVPVIWTSPESLMKRVYSYKTDVYMFAMFMYEVVARSVPYPGMTTQDVGRLVIEEHLRPTLPGYCPLEWAQIIESCWHPLADQRPTMTRVNELLSIYLNRLTISQSLSDVFVPLRKQKPNNDAAKGLSGPSGVLLSNSKKTAASTTATTAKLYYSETEHQNNKQSHYMGTYDAKWTATATATATTTSAPPITDRNEDGVTSTAVSTTSAPPPATAVTAVTVTAGGGNPITTTTTTTTKPNNSSSSSSSSESKGGGEGGTMSSASHQGYSTTDLDSRPKGDIDFPMESGGVTKSDLHPHTQHQHHQHHFEIEEGEPVFDVDVGDVDFDSHVKRVRSRAYDSDEDKMWDEIETDGGGGGGGGGGGRGSRRNSGVNTKSAQTHHHIDEVQLVDAMNKVVQRLFWFGFTQFRHVPPVPVVNTHTTVSSTAANSSIDAYSYDSSLLYLASPAAVTPTPTPVIYAALLHIFEELQNVFQLRSERIKMFINHYSIGLWELAQSLSLLPPHYFDEITPTATTTATTTSSASSTTTTTTTTTPLPSVSTTGGGVLVVSASALPPPVHPRRVSESFNGSNSAAHHCKRDLLIQRVLALLVRFTGTTTSNPKGLLPAAESQRWFLIGCMPLLQSLSGPTYALFVHVEVIRVLRYFVYACKSHMIESFVGLTCIARTLEHDYASSPDIVHMGVDLVSEMFDEHNVSTSDLCYAWLKSGLLPTLLKRVNEMIKKQEQIGGGGGVSAQQATVETILPISTSLTEAISKSCRVLDIFAAVQSRNAQIAQQLTTRSAITTFQYALTALPTDNTATLLRSLRFLLQRPNASAVIEECGVITTLVLTLKRLTARTDTLSTPAQNCWVLISHLLRNQTRQEQAVQAGLFPLLQNVIGTKAAVSQMAAEMLISCLKASVVCRKEFRKYGGLEYLFSSIAQSDQKQSDDNDDRSTPDNSTTPETIILIASQFLMDDTADDKYAESTLCRSSTIQVILGAMRLKTSKGFDGYGLIQTLCTRSPKFAELLLSEEKGVILRDIDQRARKSPITNTVLLELCKLLEYFLTLPGTSSSAVSYFVEYHIHDLLQHICDTTTSVLVKCVAQVILEKLHK